MATTLVNGAASTDGNATSAAIPGNPGRQQSKSNNLSNKAADGNRKQAGIPGDGGQRRNGPQKAWTSGMNPITQRSTTPAQQNGAGPQIKPTIQQTTIAQDMNASDRHANDRLLFLLGNLMGLQTSLTVKNGDVFSGIFFGADMENHEPAYLLKMVQQVKAGNKNEVNGSPDISGEYIGIGEEHSMSFDVKEVADLAVQNVPFDHQDKALNGLNTGFRTDADISGNISVRERSLQRWEPSAESDVDLSLEQSDGAWDQFHANEQKFGLSTDYDENIYTTRINKSNPRYRQQEAEAARIAHEIEGTSTENPHMKEERGQKAEDDEVDEEEKYSGVRRQGKEYPPLQSSQPNKYMPPARRLPTGKPTVAGAPVDPAIISSQIARPDAGSQEGQKATAMDKENEGPPSTTKENARTEPAKDAADNATSKEVVANNLRQSGPSKPSIPAASATANVETDVLDSFRQFANIEKMRVSDHRRQRVTQDKAIKLNDLMKFSKNFTLKTPVPKDLVPILAKDKSKQEEIMEKAQRNAEKSAVAAPKSMPHDPSTSRSQADASISTTSERLESINGRQAYPPQGPQGPSRERQQHANNMPLVSPKTGQGLLSHRLADSHRQHKAGIPVSVPNPIPIHTIPRNPTARPTANAPPVSDSQTSSALRTPTSATSANKFNVKAPDFRPNPAANAFKPIANPSNTSSPVSSTPNARPASRALSPSAFFGNKKPVPPAERPSISEYFNPLKRLKEIAQNDGKADDLAANGGIRYAYQTPPTWKAPNAGEEENTISYKDMFDVVPASTRVSPLPNSPIPPPLPHQHQLPLHLQHGSHPVPHIQTPPQMPYHVQPQPHHYPSGSHQYDDHRMHLPASSSSVYQSPRMQHSNMAYHSPMPQTAQLAYGQPVNQYGIVPPGPQHAQFRPFPGAPQMVSAQGPPLTATPMMVHGSSQGGYVGPPQSIPVHYNPQMPMYLPGQQVYGGQSQPPSNYPSPGRAGAPMMMHQGSHQGSHQGQQQQIYMNTPQYAQPVYAQQPPPHMMPMRGNYGSPQPHYNQSPQQQYHYPQPHRIPSNNYGPPPQGPHHHLPAQHAPPPVIPIENGEDGK